MCAGFGWVWALIVPSRRALHDVLSGTYVVVIGVSAARYKKREQGLR